MTDKDVITDYSNLSFMEQLNLFRNRYYNDGNTTEKGIIANAINDLFAEFNRQQAEIERLKGWENLLKAESHAPVKKQKQEPKSSKSLRRG